MAQARPPRLVGSGGRGSTTIHSMNGQSSCSEGVTRRFVTFGAAGGYAASIELFNRVKLFKRLVNLGDAKSLVSHPASTTHRQLSAEELRRAGIPPDMIRLSVGIEHIDDIIEDLDQALGSGP